MSVEICSQFWFNSMPGVQELAEIEVFHHSLPVFPQMFVSQKSIFPQKVHFLKSPYCFCHAVDRYFACKCYASHMAYTQTLQWQCFPSASHFCPFYLFPISCAHLLQHFTTQIGSSNVNVGQQVLTFGLHLRSLPRPWVGFPHTVCKGTGGPSSDYCSWQLDIPWWGNAVICLHLLQGEVGSHHSICCPQYTHI